MSIDATIQQLFAKVEERKKKVADLEKEVAASWKTNCSFRTIGAQTPLNIQTATEEQIEDCATHLVMIENARAAAGEKLNRKLSNKYQGYSFADWYADLGKRLAVNSIREERRQLEELDKRLNAVLSPEERRRLEVEALAREIG